MNHVACRKVGGVSPHEVQVYRLGSKGSTSPCAATGSPWIASAGSSGNLSAMATKQAVSRSYLMEGSLQRSHAWQGLVVESCSLFSPSQATDCRSCYQRPLTAATNTCSSFLQPSALNGPLATEPSGTHRHPTPACNSLRPQRSKPRPRRDPRQGRWWKPWPLVGSLISVLGECEAASAQAIYPSRAASCSEVGSQSRTRPELICHPSAIAELLILR